MFWDANHERTTLIDLRGHGSALPLIKCAFQVRSLDSTNSNRGRLNLWHRDIFITSPTRPELSRSLTIRQNTSQIGPTWHDQMVILYYEIGLLYNTLFSREENFREKWIWNIFAKISSREMSSREKIFLRLFSVPQICRLVGLGYAV